MAEEDPSIRNINDQLKEIKDSLDSKSGFFVSTSLFVTILSLVGGGVVFLFNLHIDSKNTLSEATVKNLNFKAEVEKQRLSEEAKFWEAQAKKSKSEVRQKEKELEETREKLNKEKVLLQKTLTKNTEVQEILVKVMANKAKDKKALSRLLDDGNGEVDVSKLKQILKDTGRGEAWAEAWNGKPVKEFIDWLDQKPSDLARIFAKNMEQL